MAYAAALSPVSACASHPVIVLFIASWVLAGLLYAAPDLELVSDPVQLWASPTSQSRKDKDYFDAHFGPFYRPEQIFVKAKNLPEVRFQFDWRILFASRHSHAAGGSRLGCLSLCLGGRREVRRTAHVQPPLTRAER